MVFLKSKEEVLKLNENLFNPILSGETTSQHDFPIQSNPMFDLPQLLDQPLVIDEEDMNNSNSDTTRLGYNNRSDITGLGAYYINGIPLTTLGARFGSQFAYNNQLRYNNYEIIKNIQNKLFPNGLVSNNDDDLEEINITEMFILKMIKNSNAIGLDLFLKFKLNDKQIWAKYVNLGIDKKPTFICQDLDKYNTKDIIKIKGILLNSLLNLFKVKQGIYTVLKEFIVYSELGQLHHLKENDVLEILHSTDEKIKLKHNDIIYYVKKPNYYWFNYYTKKIK